MAFFSQRFEFSLFWHRVFLLASSTARLMDYCRCRVRLKLHFIHCFLRRVLKELYKVARHINRGDNVLVLGNCVNAFALAFEILAGTTGSVCCKRGSLFRVDRKEFGGEAIINFYDQKDASDLRGKKRYFDVVCVIESGTFKGHKSFWFQKGILLTIVEA